MMTPELSTAVAELVRTVTFVIVIGLFAVLVRTCS